MILLQTGIVMWLLWLPVYWYDVSSFYNGGYRIRSHRVRTYVTAWMYTSMLVVCAGTYWLYVNFLIGLVL